MRRKTLQSWFLTSLALLSSMGLAPAAQFSSDFNAGTTPSGSVVAGNAFVDTSGGVGGGGVLKVTGNGTGQQGAYYVSDFAGGAGVTNFLVVAKVAIGGGTQRPADGMAFVFGTDTPAPAGTFGEEGAGTGITVTFDTWDNNTPDTAPAIDVRYGGAILAFQSMATNNAGVSIREGGRNADGPVLTDSAGNPVSLQTFGPGVNPTDSSFVNLVIQLFPDNTLSVSWSNVVVFNHLPIPGYTPISGGTWGFGARTGGATEDHWIDNLTLFANFTPGAGAIVTQPASQSVVESHRATFTVEVSGTPPFTAQWFSNNVAIPGADQLTYTTPPANNGMNGAVYRVEIRNSLNATPVVSANATLTVVPGLVMLSASSRNTATNVFVVFNKPPSRVGTYSLSPAVAINAVKPGPGPNEVLLETAQLTLDGNYTLTVTGEKGTDNSVLVPDPATATFHYGFGAFCHDFNDNLLPAGTLVTSAASIVGGSVHLTEASQFGACGDFWIPDQVSGTPLDRLQARWSSLIGGGGGGGADGYSFGWAKDITAPSAGSCYGGPEGAGSGLTVTVDTFDNGVGIDPGGTGIQIKWQGNIVASASIPKDDPGNGVYLRKSQFVDASVEVLPNGQATFNYDGTIISATLAGFAPIAGGNFMFSGATGGASDNQWVDNVRINCFTLSGPVFTLNPVDTTVIEGDTATFVVGVDGAPPLSVQWYTNDVPVPGAVTTHYTTPPGTAALNGLRVSAKASNDFGTTSSSVGVLHVTLAPRLVSMAMGCEPNIIHIVYTKPVQLDGTYSTDVSIVNGVSYGASQSEVLLDIDPLPPETTATVTIQDVHDQGGHVQYPNPITAIVRYGFGPFCADFNDNAVPPGTTLGGGATVGGTTSDGILHLTEAHANGACGSLFIPDQAGGANLNRLHAKWKSRVGGGDAGADGYSFNWANDITPTSGCPGSGEEGVGSGLSVTVDTFDNGAPLDVGGTGIQIKWHGNVLAFAPIPKDPDPAASTYIRKDAFVDAEVAVFSDGTAQFTYDGVTVTAALPGYGGIAGGKFMLAARTGGANDNHYIDNLCINTILSGTDGPVMNCPSQVIAECTGGLTPVTWTATARDLCEGPVPVTCTPPSGTGFRIGQSNVVCTARNSSGISSTCSFLVKVVDTTPPQVRCPGDMTVRATATNGAVVTYSAAASDACGIQSFNCAPPSGSTLPIGTNVVTCTASDPSLNTNSCSFNIVVTNPNQCPTAGGGAVTVDQDSSVSFQLAGADVDGNALQYFITQPPAHGTLLVNIGTGATTYSPLHRYCGPDSFKYKVNDGQCDSAEATVSITVRCAIPPVPVLAISCSYSDGTNAYVIAYEETNACVILNGAGSYSSNNLPLDISWFVDGSVIPYRGALVTNCLSAGCHSITLLVDDGHATTTAHTNLCIITASEAVDQCVFLVDSSVIDRKNKRPLLDALKQAGASFDRRKFKEAVAKLDAFEHKATGEVGKQNPDEAVKFIICAQNIISALTCANDLAEVGVGIDDDKLFPDNDKDIPIFMCHNGHTEAVNNPDEVAHKLAEGWTLGPCPGSTVMCHDGATVAIDNPNDVARHLAEPGGHWTLGNCPFPVIMCHDGDEELVQPDDVAHHLAERDGHWQLGPCPPPAIMCHDGKLQLVDKPSDVAKHLAEPGGHWTLGACPPGTAPGSHKP